jgi:hypothetical protein
MAYSKPKLKSHGDRASPCFKPFLIGNVSDRWNLQQYGEKYVTRGFISCARYKTLLELPKCGGWKEWGM